MGSSPKIVHGHKLKFSVTSLLDQKISCLIPRPEAMSVELNLASTVFLQGDLFLCSGDPRMLCQCAVRVLGGVFFWFGFWFGLG